MTTSPRWRAVVASAATAAALFATPLAGAGTALAMDNPHPCPSHSKPPYPPYPPKPHGYGDESDGYGDSSGNDYGDENGYGDDCPSDNDHDKGHGNGGYDNGSGSGGEHGDDSGGSHENGSGGEHGDDSGSSHENGSGGDQDKGHEKGSGHLAHTGADNKQELILGGVAAGLVALGAGSLLVVRRRNNS
ncbi:LPXTG cell wall anchor domain-containing protein [Streptomyces sp. NPDC058067]|uniref:LPXTG cell wall anchor domain-containing protein n=1 Tax=Streptomyces sp. NPDC058067 TaxID=3346324 RepID=UPI0036EA0906